jgi:hypothetical protein
MEKKNKTGSGNELSSEDLANKTLDGLNLSNDDVLNVR